MEMPVENLWKCLLKKESFEWGFEVSEGGEIPQAGRQQIPDSELTIMHQHVN